MKSVLCNSRLATRFWNKVLKLAAEECWLWQASTFREGYGAFSVDYLMRSAHRVSWELANGAIPEGLHVLHECDVRRCVNPDHLFLGTQLDNMQDMKAKGRSVYEHGQNHPRAKLSDWAVGAIRDSYEGEDITMKELAEEFEVSRSTISRIINQKQRKSTQ